MRDEGDPPGHPSKAFLARGLSARESAEPFTAVGHALVIGINDLRCRLGIENGHLEAKPAWKHDIVLVEKAQKAGPGLGDTPVQGCALPGMSDSVKAYPLVPE